jgi:hypothetical protein
MGYYVFAALICPLPAMTAVHEIACVVAAPVKLAETITSHVPSTAQKNIAVRNAGRLKALLAGPNPMPSPTSG